jgi:hypothetical protein
VIVFSRNLAESGWAFWSAVFIDSGDFDISIFIAGTIDLPGSNGENIASASFVETRPFALTRIVSPLIDFGKSNWLPSIGSWGGSADAAEAGTAGLTPKSIGALTGSLGAVAVIAISLVFVLKRLKEQQNDNYARWEYETDAQTTDDVRTALIEDKDDEWAVDAFERDRGETFDFTRQIGVAGDQAFMSDTDEFF